ncbi:glycosyl hydrolase [Wenyingzhuangia sp. chi5]|uniref:Glycosyl hydrolase n=1 Tax=Wenyingzhuangia gilva TaxID=3057677 RepID=A0ABT8VQT1_9FLAO|nr:glycosyl hydrolase [Wenyingzhuangia sp. chi5]MDO3694326.1 glycosyl hydrolase [Wenyingzhuangia sp. chi5]
MTNKLPKVLFFFGINLTTINSKPKHISKVFLLFYIAFNIQAQAQDVDITQTHLNNAGFDINCNYLTGGSETISSAGPPNTTEVYGWTLSDVENKGWGAASTFEFGWNGSFNGSSLPATDTNGLSGSEQGALGINVGWSGDLIYQQQATLPAGLYSIEVSSAFEGNNTIQANLTGWVGNDGNSVFSAFTNSQTLGTWNTSIIPLRLPSETTGSVHVGVRGANSGTGSNARVFVDYIKLISHPVTKVNLQKLIDSAKVMIATPKPVPNGSTVYSDLQTAITNEQATLDDQAANAEAILTGEDNLSLAIEAVHTSIFEANLVTYNNHTATYTSLNNQNIKLTGKGQITITSSTNPIMDSAIDIATPDTWIYFQNTLPSEVASTYLSSITVNTQEAVIGSNIRVTNYLKGAMVMAHSSTYTALTAFDKTNQKGTSMDFSINKHYRASELNDMEDNIESFILKRGYMATFAVNENGTGGSRVYIADDTDLIIDEMPEGLSNSISMVVVRQWRWTTKKGWRGSSSGGSRFNAGSSYDYNNADYGTLDIEYVPMRHNPNWNSYGNFMDKFSSTHALGYNEPDNSVDDGFSSVDDAIREWPKMMESGLRLGAPGTTDGGLNWTYEFIDRCDALGYRVDFVPWHFYRANNTAQQLYNQLLAVHNRTGRPIWITEFNNGCNWTYNGNAPTAEKNGQVIQEFIKMLEDAPFVERYYVWDGCNETLRMTNSGNGELYPAGVAYRDQVSTMAYTEDFYNTVSTKTIQENEPGFCALDGSIDSNYPHTGTGFSNTTNAIGSGIDYKINFMSDRIETLTIRYASPVDCPANILINGSIVATAPCLSTGSFDTYSEVSINIQSSIGMADLRIEATTDKGLGNIDYITITGGYPASCEPNPTYPIIISASDEEAGNPAKNLLDGNTADDFRWSANGFPQTAVIDYGENKSIIGTRISTFQNRAYQYTIELSDNLYFTNSYIVDRSTNTSTTQPISDDFDKVTARYARFTITGASGYSGDWSSITEFKIIEADGLSNKKITDEIKVHPNPVNDYLNISFEGDYFGYKVNIFNLTGKLVMQTSLQNQNNRLNLSNLKAGVYLLKITDKYQSTKIIKVIKL